MSLSSALSIAQSSIKNTGRQTSVVSRNVLEAGNTDYARRTAVLSSMVPGARVVEIQRATNEQLFKQNLAALSASSGQSTLYAGMDQLGLSVNGVDNAASPATAIGRLQEALQLYATSPSNQSLAENTVDAARQLVRSLNEGTTAIQNFRVEADQQIDKSVAELNDLLAQFGEANTAVMSGTRAGRDVSDALDQRDAVLKQIAEYVPVSTLSRGDDDVVLLTGDGATLFETAARKVSFSPATSYSAGVTGAAVLIDGVPVKAGADGQASGKIAGLVQLRDSVSATMQAQLDEVARGLIAAFAETDQPGGAVLPDAPGLFTWNGAPGMPAAGTLVDGLAGTIGINAAMDSAQGGNPSLLRDGGANGAGYVANTSGGPSYSSLLIAYSERLDTPMTFDASTGITPNASVSAYSANAIGWFENVRQSASRSAEASGALAVRTAEALSNETGINVDMEMSLLLDLEHSYQASARLIRAVDEMLATLLDAVR